jgi:hypothetical protein
VLATSAFGCATGWRSELGTFCFRQSSREACAGKKPNTRAGGWSACSHTLKSLPGVCNLRTFAQFRFVQFRRFEIAGPLGNPFMKMVSRIPLCLWPDGGIPADEWLSSPGQPEVNAKGSNSGNNSNNHIA